MAGRITYYGNIVKDGLVLDLDAAKRDSYPGTGAAWNDISGSVNNKTLINGPTFSSTNGGSILFDGTNDYLSNNSYNPFVVGSMTYEIVFKANSNPINGPLGSSDIVNTIPYFYLDYGGGNIRTYHTASSPQYFTVQSLSLGTINHFVCTRNGLTESNYVNGTGTLGRTLSSSAGNSNGFGGVGGFSALSLYFNCNIYLIRIYNRALSASEVLQNYNATKGRYL
jgi:hypothetical protein